MELFAAALSLAYKYLGPPDKMLDYEFAISLDWKGEPTNVFPLLTVVLQKKPGEPNSVLLNGERVENPLELLPALSEEIVRKEKIAHARSEA